MDAYKIIEWVTQICVWIVQAPFVIAIVLYNVFCVWLVFTTVVPCPKVDFTIHEKINDDPNKEISNRVSKRRTASKMARKSRQRNRNK